MVALINSPIQVQGAMQEDSVEISSDDDHARTTESTFIYKHRLGVVELHRDTLKCLDEREYVKDTIIQFYLAYLLNDVCEEKIASRVHIFDSIFYEQMDKAFDKTRVDEQKRWQLTRWYDGVDIFDRDFLIFPVCSGSHWYAIVVCYPWAVKSTFDISHPFHKSNGSSNGSQQNNDSEKPSSKDSQDTRCNNDHDKTPGIIVMDSLRLREKKITLRLRDFLDFEWRNRDAEIKRFSHHDLRDYFPDMVKQDNAYDCGIYVMMYVRCFLNNPEHFYRIVKQEDSSAATRELRELTDQFSGQYGRDKIRKLIEKICQHRNS